MRKNTDPSRKEYRPLTQGRDEKRLQTEGFHSLTSLSLLFVCV
jgi:hypothetical protein